MASRVRQPDVAALFHAASSNVRERTPELDVDWDRRPRAHRSYAGAPRTPLPGRDLDHLALPLGAALAARRSVRELRLAPLPAATAGRLLHAAAGVRGVRQVEGRWLDERTFPSAGGLYPVEVYVATQAVEGVPDGVHHYDARAHELVLRRPGRFGAELAEMTIGQEVLREASLIVALTGIGERSAWKYGQRGHRYVWIEAGHIAENAYLAAAALGLGAVAIGGFFDGELDALLRLPRDERTLYLVALGRPTA